MGETQFDIRLRVMERQAGIVPVSRQGCPGCGHPMMFHQPDENNPHRLLANCLCEECGVWFAVIIRPDDQVVYLVRLPSVIELVEAIARRGWEPGPRSRDGD